MHNNKKNEHKFWNLKLVILLFALSTTKVETHAYMSRRFKNTYFSSKAIQFLKFVESRWKYSTTVPLYLLYLFDRLCTVVAQRDF